MDFAILKRINHNFTILFSPKLLILCLACLLPFQMLKIAFISAALIAETLCTTEWFGDLRAHLNPPQLPPFYDIVYDDSECPFGLESIAIPEYVYFGEMIATKAVREHSACLQYCLETPRCKSVNYFESLGKKEKKGMGFCELLMETQYDNPRLMRPFRKATYYEKIRCRTSDEDDEQPFEFDGNGKEGKQLVLAPNAGGDGRSGESKQSVGKRLDNIDSKKGGGERESGQENETTSTTVEAVVNTKLNADKEMRLKKLEQKVQEFNLRFKSR